MKENFIREVISLPTVEKEMKMIAPTKVIPSASFVKQGGLIVTRCLGIWGEIISFVTSVMPMENKCIMIAMTKVCVNTLNKSTTCAKKAIV